MLLLVSFLPRANIPIQTLPVLVRLTQGLDTLNGVVAGLEERLRTSVREDTNKILVSLLPNAPRLPDSTVGFGVIPDGTPDGLDGEESLTGFGDLAGRVTEVRDELQAKAHIIEEIKVLYCHKYGKTS